jgi:23S rRNA (cytidine2498-2'-O)-methyltransferase
MCLLDVDSAGTPEGMSDSESKTAINPPVRWIFRISESFGEWVPEILTELGASKPIQLGKEYYLVNLADADGWRDSDAAMFVRWNMPAHHVWPCCPQKMEGFVEKAAQGLFRKFVHFPLQTLLSGPLLAGAAHPYYRHLATNLRGRALQLFPDLKPLESAEHQDPAQLSLFCLVGKEGLYSGVISPQEAKGFYPGGTKFVSQSSPQAISRAGAKIAEALHYLTLHAPLPVQGSEWLELGASPGGMTSELLERGYRVTAVDRAELDARLDRHPGLTFSRQDVFSYQAPGGKKFAALLCDMNGSAISAIKAVTRLTSSLSDQAWVIFTLKTAGADSLAEVIRLYHGVVAIAEQAGLKLKSRTHLTYNRQELTLFFQKA